MSSLGRELLTRDDPPVTVLVITAANPVLSNPDQARTREGLSRTDLFTVVVDHRLTETAAYADLVLPVEEAPADLYAGPWDTFTRVTLPLATPGIIGAALLSFSLSFDDFITTSFVAGDVMTFPRFVYVSYLRGIPAQANVIGFAMFAFAVLAVVAYQLVARRRR